MYTLFERLSNKEDESLGEFETLQQCENFTEERCKQLDEQGFTRAQFYCVAEGETMLSVGWIYHWREENDVCK